MGLASGSKGGRDKMGKHEVARRAVFLDRDGVLNRPVIRNGQPHPPSSVEDFELYDDVADGCARLKAAEFLLVVISNQPDVGRGTQSREAVEAMHVKMQSALPSLDRSRFVIMRASVTASRAIAESRDPA